MPYGILSITSVRWSAACASSSLLKKRVTEFSSKNQSSKTKNSATYRRVAEFLVLCPRRDFPPKAPACQSGRNPLQAENLLLCPGRDLNSYGLLAQGIL